MKTIAFDPDWMKGVEYRYEHRCYTPAEDVAAILHLCRSIVGNVVEIGANTGITTRHLAINMPERTIYAADYIGRLQTMIAEQSDENPLTSVFSDCEGIANVVGILSRGGDLRYEALVDVGTVFIDGDHTYEGVKADTCRAFDHLQDRGIRSLLLWHDCSEHETWSGVYRWLCEFERLSELEVTRIDNSSLAFTYV